MAEEDDAQKTEEPTQKKLSDAMQKGDFAKSQEIKNWFVLFGAAIVAVVLVAVYVLLWALLNLADYALIVGSVMVFAALAITMYATRNINWYNPRNMDDSPAPDAS